MKKAIKYIVESLFDNDKDVVDYDPTEDVISSKYILDVKTIKDKILNNVLLSNHEKQYLNDVVGVIMFKSYLKLIDFCRKCIFTQKIYNLNFINIRYITTLSYFWRYVTDGHEEQLKESIDISKWDVSNVTDMNHAFECYEAFNSDISGWNVSNVTDMSYMFAECTQFNLNLNNWNVSNVKKMAYMFGGCTLFNSDLNQWDVSNVVSMTGVFNECTSFNGDVTTWDISKCTLFRRMFYNCISFKLDLSNWKFKIGDSVNQMFGKTTYPTEILKMNKVLRNRLNARGY